MATKMAKMETTLPDEIINEVLLKLPVKSLTRFKCVSMPWCVLISNPLFAITHYLNQSKIEHNQTFFTIPSIGLGLRSEIVGSCHGLICTHCKDSNSNSNRFFVLNPTTRDCKVLSHPGYPGYPLDKDSFDYEEREFFGFSYNSSLDDYYVVTIFTREDGLGDKSSVGRVGSLRTNSWKKIQECPYELFPQMGVYVSGAIHWINYDMNVIVAFDLAKEEFKEVPLIHKSKPVEVETLGVHKGFLCKLPVEYEDSSLILWTMVEYGVRESWTKLVIFPESFSPLDAEKGIFLVTKAPIWYNVKEETFELLGIKHLSEQSLDNPFQLIKYEESLISPLAYGNNENDD